MDSEYHLSFQLSERQQKISNDLCQLVNEGHSVLLEAVCGAGKTELVYQSISESLKRGKKVGFAIPRRQVVLEIADRLQSVFTNLKVVAVCQGHNEDINGDVVVCTTHQLFRYYQYFDVLIIDEPDAFPYKGNMVLQGIAQRAVKGVKIYLSATPDETLLKEVSKGNLKYLFLSKRPSGKDIVVPKCFYGPNGLCVIVGLFQLLKLLKQGRQVMLFVPTIKTGRRMYRYLKSFISCGYMDSKIENKDEIIQRFKKKKFPVLITTSVLERGITIKKVQVIVYDSCNGVFDEASLVQMAGRVGRDVKDPTGVCLFLSSKRCESIDHCIQRIVRANND